MCLALSDYFPESCVISRLAGASADELQLVICSVNAAGIRGLRGSLGLCRGREQGASLVKELAAVFVPEEPSAEAESCKDKQDQDGQ